MMALRAVLLFIFMTCVCAAFAQADTVLVHSFGGPFYEEGADIIACAAGGYAMIGTTGSNETGNTDMYVLRLDDQLNCMWHRNYGGSQVEWGVSLVEDLSGNLLLAGYTSSSGAGSYDMLVVKVDPQGDEMWQHTYGGADWDFGKKILRHPQGGFLLAGNTYSAGNGGQDGVLMHIDGNGTELQRWYFGGAEEDGIADITPAGNGWAVCGYSNVNDTTGAMVWRMNIAGDVLWTRRHADGAMDLKALSIAFDGNYFYSCGERSNDNVHASYIQRLTDASNEIMYDNSDHLFADCSVWNGNMSFAGSSDQVGFGEYDAFLQRFTVDYGWVGAMFYGTTRNERFAAVLETENGMLLCGALEETDGSSQALVMLYRRPTLYSEQIPSPELLDCFTVQVEELVPAPSAFSNCDVLNLQGSVVLTNVAWSELPRCNRLSAGIYLARETRTGVVRKIFID